MVIARNINILVSRHDEQPPRDDVYTCDLWLQIDWKNEIILAKDRFGLIAERQQSVNLQEMLEDAQAEAKTIEGPQLSELEEDDLIM